ncbi:3-deoxy-7-phosphoheptulonate synthase [bacterium]|nr:3-deoxy-7-phosphoheptulonate synthase [bacterium]
MLKYIRKLPEPEEIKKTLPLSQKGIAVKKKIDDEVKMVFDGRSEKFILVIGPCSADNEEAIMEYVKRLSALQAEVKDRLILMARIYTNKPRTTGKGYKGMLYQPDPQQKPDMCEGIKAIRHLHIRVLEECGLPIADEMLYPGNYPYVDDVLSYVAVGARSVENQQHRLTCSGAAVPVGMKNPTGGDFSVMLNAVEAAQSSHVFAYNGFEVETSGNAYTHCILRGAVDYQGNNISNYDEKNIMAVIRRYEKRGLENPAIIIDTNHANSGKDYHKQPSIAMHVLKLMKDNKEIGKIVKGFMIESYLVEGRQDIAGGGFGQSITDPCLGWEDTEKLVKEIAENI